MNSQIVNISQLITIKKQKTKKVYDEIKIKKVKNNVIRKSLLVNILLKCCCVNIYYYKYV